MPRQKGPPMTGLASSDEQTDETSRARAHEAVELSDDIRHGIAQILQRLNYGRELEGVDLAKEYLDGHIGILIKLNTHSSPNPHHASTTIWPHAKSAIVHRHGHSPIWVQDFQMS